MQQESKYYSIVINTFDQNILIRLQVCELCPNVDGLLQSTENGRWVHARCILFQKDPTKISIDSVNIYQYSEYIIIMFELKRHV